MLATKEYDRMRALAYARRWAFARNPLFNDYSPFGGDCTNFVSQCLLAGALVMNETPNFGWYYKSDLDRAPDILRRRLIRPAGDTALIAEGAPIRTAVKRDEQRDICVC